MATDYELQPTETGLTIELTGVGGNAEPLLAAFGECAAGACSCPTDEYQKVEAMEVSPGADSISIVLTAKAGETFDTSEIDRCLDYTIDRAGR